MMIYPPVNELLDKVDQSRYTLVMEVAKRAREIVDGDARLVESAEDEKPVSVAVREVYEDKIVFERPEGLV